MKYKTNMYIAVFLLLAACAAQEEPVVTREPKKLITEDDYKDLQIFHRLDKYKEAVTQHNKALSIKPNDLTIHINFGNTLTKIWLLEEFLFH